MSTLINFANEAFVFDAKITEDYTEEATVTEHPIESGGFVTDHRVDRPLILNLEGVVSESPFAGMEQGILVDVAGKRGLAALQWFRASRGHTLTHVSKRFGVVSSLVIESLETSVPATASTRFRLRLKQVAFASAQIVDLPPEFVPPKGQGPKECSVQPTTDLTGFVGPLQPARPASFLRIGDDASGDALSRIIVNSGDFWNFGGN